MSPRTALPGADEPRSAARTSGEHGIAADRGRIVRAALSVLLADLEAKHHDSILVRRLPDR